IVQGLLESLWSVPALQDQKIGFLDAGLTAEQTSWLGRPGGLLKGVGWDPDFPVRAQWEQQVPGFKVMVARPQIRDHFPGFDVYLWMDADIWVQRGEPVGKMVAGPASGGLDAWP